MFIVANHNSDFYKLINNQNANQSRWVIVSTAIEHEYGSIAFITKHKTYPKDSTIISSKFLKRNIELKPEFKEQAINIFKSFANILTLCD